MTVNNTDSKLQTSEFITLLTNHQNALKGFIISLLPGSNDVADVLQETNLVLWEKMENYESGTNFRAWAFSIAKFKSLQHREKLLKQQKAVFSDEFISLIADAKQAEQPEHQDSRMQALQLCLNLLKPSEKEQVYARYSNNQTLENYAQKIGRSSGSVRVTLHRIRQKLHHCINTRLNQEGGLA